MDKVLRQWIKQIIWRNERVMRIAVRQRAKFESWLKFELAAIAEENGAESVKVESSIQNAESAQRADISFTYRGVDYDIELKTPNTNWRTPGVANAHRPITRNIAGIVKDGKKLRASSRNAIVTFVMFPIPPSHDQWKSYIARIAEKLQQCITTEDNCERVELAVDHQYRAELIVCTFGVSK